MLQPYVPLGPVRGISLLHFFLNYANTLLIVLSFLTWTTFPELTLQTNVQHPYKRSFLRTAYDLFPKNLSMWFVRRPRGMQRPSLKIPRFVSYFQMEGPLR
jgi:hypothetical protein